MQSITIAKTDIPIWKIGEGSLNVQLNISDINQPLPTNGSDLLSIKFDIAGNKSVTFGNSSSLKLGFDASVGANLTPIWPSSVREDLTDTLTKYGLDNYFKTNPQDLLLVLSLGASAKGTLDGSFSYSVLSATATLELGSNGSYTYIKPFPASTPALEVVTDFFKEMRLPANITTPPQPGEVIALEYGGYLNIGAGLSLGYALSGSSSFNISDLSLSEQYQLNVLAKIGFAAKVAGYFGINVSAALDDKGIPIKDWARVTVSKKHSSQLSIAADVNVSASANTQGLPDSGKDFLGALLGINPKNWVNWCNWVEKAYSLTDLNTAINTLKTQTDELTQSFISKWVGKGFNALASTDFSTFLDGVRKVVDSYNNIDDTAITLFDKYYDKVTILTDKLNELASLKVWDELKGEVDGELWDILRQLTDGDPLNWMLGKINTKDKNANPITTASLPELQKRIQDTLNLIQSDAHTEIRKVISIAKQNFRLDDLIAELSNFDTVDKLKSITDDKLIGFVQRLTGQAIDKIKDNKTINEIFTEVRNTLTALKTFGDSLYEKLKDALNQSFSFNLHYEYSRASETDNLIDVEINLSTEQGKTLTQAATIGDFSALIAGYQPDLIKINNGVFTHKVTKQTALNINIIGWHLNWQYQSLYKVIVNTEQQIKTESNGALTVFTNIDLTLENDKKKTKNGNWERVYTNFLLRFIGESSGIIGTDPVSKQYLIDTITCMAASYELFFENSATTSNKLADYLKFAQDFGLSDKDATAEKIAPYLPINAQKNFGYSKVDYQVRYTEDGLRSLFANPLSEASVRLIMRRIVLTNYRINPAITLPDIGWCYWTESIYQLYKSEGFASFTNHSQRSFINLSSSPFLSTLAPKQINLSKNQLNVLSTLYQIEDDVVDGFKALYKVINQATKISPKDFEEALSKVGDALKGFDSFDEGENTIFAVFDGLILRNLSASQARTSSLTLTTKVDPDEEELTKVFVSISS
ncbi:MAG: hypothetical protein WAQ98_04445 [Blastocatellia bacterium]